MNNTSSPTTIQLKGRTLYRTPDGTGYETSKARRQRRLAETAEPVCRTHGIPAWEHTEPCAR